VDIGGTTYSYGAFSSGETKTQEVDVPVSETELYFTGHDGKVDWTLKKEEITDTSNVSIQVNGKNSRQVTTESSLTGRRHRWSPM